MLSSNPHTTHPCEHSVRQGLNLCWGSDASGTVLGAQASITTAAALLMFVLGEDGARSGDRMTLLRPASLGACGCASAVVSFHATIALAENAWHALIADEKTPGAVHVRQFAADASAASITLPLTPAARLAVESIRRCPFGGACREMALSARCHDLLLEFLTTLSATHAPRPVTLTQSLEQQVRRAAELLTEDLESPPTVAELARRVGLSETTLKRGFHQIFDTTIFGYLRARRMERAHALLQSGQATVLEAAAFVGYSNPSNFAAAFRRQFGVNPKQFQLAVRR